MITAMLLTAGQAQTGTSLDAALSNSEQITDRAIECMDAGFKAELKTHIIDATPELVVDAAIASCAHLKAEYAKAVVTPDTYISSEKGAELADDWLATLRETYLKHAEKSLSDPEFSDKRARLVTMMWSDCIRKKAVDWSRLKDEAATIGKAAVTSCSSERANLRRALSYSLRAKKLPDSAADTVLEKVEAQMQDKAVETVISERAKRLPK